MTRVCAWCHMILSKSNDSNDETALVTHGICAECALREISARELVLRLDEAALLQLLTGQLTRITGYEDGEARPVWLHLTEPNLAAFRGALDEAERRLRPADSISPG